MAGADPWGEFVEVKAGAGGAPRPLFTVPDPGGEAKERRDNANAQRDEGRFGIEARNEERSIDKQRFDKIDTLRQRYNGNEQVKAFETALPMFVTALNTAPNLDGDQLLITSFAKLSDPTTGVLGGEREGVAQGSQSWVENKTAELTKLLTSEGGVFSDKTRKSLRGQLILLMNQRNDAYNTQRLRYKADAEAEGLDPVRVIGPHAAERSRAALEQYDRSQQQARSPEMVGGVPKGSEVRFGMDGSPEGAFDRNAWLKKMGLDPDEEAEIVAFWNENRGNKELTVPAAKKWFADRGYSLPSEADLNGAVRDARKGMTFTAMDSEAARKAYEAKLEEEYQRRLKDGLIDQPGLIDKGRQGVAGGLADEASGVGGAISSAFNDRTAEEGYTFERDLERYIQKKASDRTGMMGTAVEFLGNAAGASGAGNALPSVGESALAGAVPGFGYGEGAQDSLTGAALGGGAGAALGAMAQKLASRVPAPPKASESAERYAAGQRYGIDMSAGDAGPMGSRLIERGLDTQPASASIMDASRAKLSSQVTKAANDVADTFGAETSFRGMGEAAQKGANRWIDKFNAVSGKLYEAIPIKPTAKSDLTNTRTALAELTSGFESNPALAKATENATLIKYRDALKTGGLSWQDLKAFRSDIGEQMGEALLSDGTRKGQLKALYAALSKDMEATATAQGPGALKAWKRANDNFAAGQERIEGAIKALLGNDTKGAPEKAAAFLQRIAIEGRGSSDLARLAEVRKTLRNEEWGSLSNGFIRLMGQPLNKAEREFSPQTFIRNYRDMSAGAKNLLFGGENKALRQNLDDFAKVVGDLADNDATRNVSRTAASLGGITSLGLGGAAGASIGGLPGALAGIAFTQAAQYGAAKLWTNPGFVRWATGYAKMLRGAAKAGAVNPQAHASQMGALERLATSNSAIAADALGLQRQLVERLQLGAPMQGAAEPGASSQDSPTKAEAAQ